MSLEIYVDDPAFSRRSSALFFENEGYYWFMHPWFEDLAVQTGKYIDLYGDAEFAPGEYSRLLAMVEEVRQEVLKQPECWNVSIGTQTHPSVKELFCEVNRETFLKLLQGFESLINQATGTQSNIVCFGD